MTARAYKFTTLNTTNLQQVSSQQPVLLGASLVNTTDDPYYVKFYWVNGANPPTVGTTIPDLTLAAPPLENASGGAGTLCPSWPFGVTKTGRLYVAVTAAAGDSDTTAVAAGQGIITLLLDGVSP